MPGKTASLYIYLELNTDEWLTKRNAQLKSTNVALDPSSTCHRAVVIHPGFPPQAVDRFGNPSLMGLVLLERVARQMTKRTPSPDGRCFLEINKMMEARLTFMASSVYSISKHAYDTEEKKCPLQVVLEVGHVGRTSFSIVSTMTLPSGHVMMTTISQIILIDPATRRPTPIPDYWREYYGPLCVRRQPTIVPKQSPPETTDIPTSEPPHHRLTVAWSDTDYVHTNYSSYVRFAVDAVMSAVMKGTLNGHLTLADVTSGVSEVKVAYLGESSQGDVLDVQLWCPLPEERTVVCSMEKEGGQPVCQVTMAFHQTA